VKVRFRSCFLRDLKKIRDPLILATVKQAIERVDGANTLDDIEHFRKLSGAAGYYRIRIGDYRIGLAACEDGLECVRFLHRRDIYKRFP
jgi:mRNA interferase RelE/StbE